MEFHLTPDQIAASRIVVVDDDALVTSALRSFLMLELDVEPISFNDAPAALAYLVKNDVDVVISDFLMPQMDGIRLLSELRSIHPEVPRILLTGYADKDSAIKAINEVQLFHYLEKPWDNAQLRVILTNALERRFLMRELSARMEELEAARGDLKGLRRAVMRAFA